MLHNYRIRFFLFFLCEDFRSANIDALTYSKVGYRLRAKSKVFFKAGCFENLHFYFRTVAKDMEIVQFLFFSLFLSGEKSSVSSMSTFSRHILSKTDCA
jgi:hypothetical protein